jgi:hypothetical protein
VDPIPCAEDEEFFEGRPDNRIIYGRDKATGTHWFRRPAHAAAGSASACAGFLPDLDEKEKKSFTPSELMPYKHAVEYRYISVHTCTYKYIPVHTSTYLYIRATC